MQGRTGQTPQAQKRLSVGLIAKAQPLWQARPVRLPACAPYIRPRRPRLRLDRAQPVSARTHSLQFASRQCRATKTQPHLRRGQKADAETFAVCASCARNILCAAGGKARALACPIFPRAIRQSFHATKRAGGSFPKWKTAPARITFSQYRNICHIGVTMSI
jgi:hypothetical protein